MGYILLITRHKMQELVFIRPVAIVFPTEMGFAMTYLWAGYYKLIWQYFLKNLNIF